MHRTRVGHDIEVVALTPHEWRVCDGSIEENDARRVLGYIEERPGMFEVLALRPAPRVQGEYESWNEALSALVSAARSAA